MQRRSFLGWMFAAPVAAKAATALPVTPAPVAVPEIVAAEISKAENEIVATAFWYPAMGSDSSPSRLNLMTDGSWVSA